MDWKTIALALCTLFFWSSAFAVIRAGLAWWGPGELALARFLVASFTLAALLALRRGRRARQGEQAGSAGRAVPAQGVDPACAGIARDMAAGGARRRAPGAAGGPRLARAAEPGEAAEGGAARTSPDPRPAAAHPRRVPPADSFARAGTSPRRGTATGWWLEAGRFLLLGATGIFVYHTGLNWGETRVSAGTASLLVATAPALTAILSRLTGDERLSARGWQGIVLSFVGVAIISWAAAAHASPAATAGRGPDPSPSAAPAAASLGQPGAPQDGGPGRGQGSTGPVPLPAWAGPAAVGLAALGTSAFFVLQRPMGSRYDSLTLTAGYTWAGTLLLAVAFGAGFVRNLQAVGFREAAWLPVLYLGVFPSALAYWCWSAALARAPAARVASLLNLNPLLAIVLAWLLLGERPAPAEMLGGAVALAGVLLVQAAPRSRARLRSGLRHRAPAR